MHPQGRRRVRRRGSCARPLCRAADPKRPVVCFDESPIQLIGEARQPIPPHPDGSSASTTSIAATHRQSLRLRRCPSLLRRVKSPIVAPLTTSPLHARTRRCRLPRAERIRVVLDNLSTHTAAALYAGFPLAEARRVLSGLSSTTRPSTPAGSTWLDRDRRAQRPMSRSPHRKRDRLVPRSTSGSLS